MVIKLENIHWAVVVIIYAIFLGLIVFAIYITKSATPLWALLLTPSYTYNRKKNKKKYKK